MALYSAHGPSGACTTATYFVSSNGRRFQLRGSRWPRTAAGTAAAAAALLQAACQGLHDGPHGSGADPLISLEPTRDTAAVRLFLAVVDDCLVGEIAARVQAGDPLAPAVPLAMEAFARAALSLLTAPCPASAPDDRARMAAALLDLFQQRP
jgi:hypothetical protein